MSEPNTYGAAEGLSDNAAGAIAYITFIPAIIFLIVAPYNKSAYVRFHAWQSILLTVAAVIIDVVLGIVIGILVFAIPFFIHMLLWRLIELAWLIIWLVCLINAAQGNRFKLPFIGAWAEQMANK